MKLSRLLAAIDAGLVACFKWLCVILFAVLTLIIAANVFVRYVPIMSLHWLDEIVELSFAWMVFFGSAAVWILKGHFSAGDWISKRIKRPRGKAFYRLAVDCISFVFMAIFFRYSAQLVARSSEVTAVFEFPKKIIYACMPISAGVMLLYSLRFIVEGIVRVVRPARGEEKPAA